MTRIEQVPHRTIGDAGAVGQSIDRVDGPAKVAGRAEFTGDMHVASMAFGRVLRSPLARARIVDIDVRDAEAIAGVVAVVTAADLSDIDATFGHAIRDRPILADGQVRFMGEPVVAVAAETDEIAQRAVEAIRINYEPLDPVVDVEDAIADDAVAIHTDFYPPGFAHGLGELGERDGNICYTHRITDGDAHDALQSADIVVEGTYRFPAVYQYALEPHTVIADHTGAELTVWASCQHPFLVRAELASIFELALDKVRVIVPYLGGGFGSKSYTKMEPIAAVVSRKAGRPVRIANRVDEAMVTTRRHGMICEMRTGAAADGTLVGREVRMWLDTGAYADNGPRVTATAADAAPGPYRWDAVSVEANCVYTNTAPSGSYRAFGATHLQWIGESQIDRIGRQAGIDPLEMRRKNLHQRGDILRAGGTPLDGDLIGDIEKVATALDWGAERGPDRGVGLSVGVLAAGAHPVSSATIKLGPDGRATLLVGSTEMGQGTRTAMAQIASEVLTIPVSSIDVHGADTWFTPYDRSTGASRSTTVAGKAVERAAREVAAALRETGAELLGTDSEHVVLIDGAATHGDATIPFDEVVRHRFGFSGGEIIGSGEVRPTGGTGSYAEGPVFWEVCIGGVEIEVDRDTGEVRVVHSVGIADVGRAINPDLIRIQDEGGTMQGLGNALFEEMEFSADGLLRNDTLLDYRIPTTADIPDRFDTIIVENEDGPGPFGAKGCGEGILAAIPAAVVNALGSMGIEINRLPATPERVWRAMQSSAEGVQDG
ncbi:MAG: xanthine dehydrogenase family protein molybdopterin-binding subunit [Armatimonadetes bacterium]|nr:MAG: xanthine dehydrogenase family protein molybdopterin-binding subunit [Armatimonadota bacterium]